VFRKGRYTQSDQKLILHSGLSAIKQFTESARLVVSVYVIHGSLAVPK